MYSPDHKQLSEYSRIMTIFPHVQIRESQCAIIFFANAYCLVLPLWIRYHVANIHKYSQYSQISNSEIFRNIQEYSGIFGWKVIGVAQYPKFKLGKRGIKYLLYLSTFSPPPVTKYQVTVHTGDKFGAGTDANVFCALFGELGDTGDRPLRKSSTNRNKFERRQVSFMHHGAKPVHSIMLFFLFLFLFAYYLC